MNKPLTAFTATVFFLACAQSAHAKDGFNSLNDMGNAMATAMSVSSGSTAASVNYIAVNPTDCLSQQYVYLPATRLTNWDLVGQITNPTYQWYRV